MKKYSVYGLAILIFIAGALLSLVYLSNPTSSSNQTPATLSNPKANRSIDEVNEGQPVQEVPEPATSTSIAAPPKIIVNSNAPGVDVLLLYECSDVPTNETDLQARLEVLRELEREERRDYQSMILAAVAEYEKCSTISPEVRRSRTEVLAEFADSGDDGEKLRFVNEGMPNELDSKSVALYQERSREYLKQLLDKGNAAALRAKAMAYTRGSAYPRDPAKAYSYMFAYAIAEPRDERVAATLVMVESRMDPRVIESLRAVGSDLAKCCIN